jgi:energy-coupling factor transport system permease protein
MDLLRSLPIGLYLEQPVSWLHRIDARVKLGWLMSFLLTPIGANPLWRLSLVGWLLVLTVSTRLPLRVWLRQMGLVTLLSVLVFSVTLFLPDGVTVTEQPRLPVNELQFQQLNPPATNPTPVPASLTNLPQPTGYRYVLFDPQLPIRLRGVNPKITRRSLELAIRAGTLTFVLLYTTNLYLLTTAPEEITAGLDALMRPLRRFNIPVTEIVLTLTLSLRFIPLVLEEVQNLVRSVRTRAINWKKLKLRGTLQVWLMIAERLLDNLLLRAEQIASAMQVRGFTGPNQHRVKWHQFRLRLWDWLVLAGIVAFWGARLGLGG